MSENGTKQWTVERWLAVLTFISTALAITFGIGANWARITEAEARQRAFEATYLRVDLYDRDQIRLSESLDRLTRQLEQMQSGGSVSTPSAQPRNRTTTRRMFDR